MSGPTSQPLSTSLRTKQLAKALGHQVRSVQRFRQAVVKVENPLWVQEWKGNPPHRENLKGMTALQRQGKKYERLFHTELQRLVADGASPLAEGTIRSGQWLRFEDEQGKSWAQPDFYVPCPSFSALWIFETKLTFVDTAVEQLCWRYGPLLATLYPDLLQYRVVVCHNLAATDSGLLPRCVPSLDAVLEADSAPFYVWNWRGAGL